MTTEVDNEDADTEGGMSEHLQRYRKYIESLKQGRSSGISSVFGRASDLLPPDVIEIKPPKVVAEHFPKDVNTELEAESIEDGSINNAANLEDWNNSFEENMNDDQVEDDEDFAEDRSDDENAGEEADDDSSDDHDDDDYVEREIVEDEEQDSPQEQIEYDSEESSEDEESEELKVTSAQGVLLWTIYFNRVAPLTITMADGSAIKNAEGRDDTILALKTEGDKFKYFILSGLVIDPITGNIYAEANDGAFTAAFMNNGWQIQQYRSHDGEEKYYATEPYKPGRDRLTMQITNVSLDPVNGEVSYDSLDGSASMTLKSRNLLRPAES